ncbi:MAG: hypothetical protein KBF48_12975 [Xanthomonadales bacterium]|nr:hypothetical protein [Xanthomonadales bacterium]
MALITSADIMLRVRDVIQDPSSLRWLEAEGERWLLDAQVKVASVIPGAGPTGYVTKALAVGIEQSITDNGAGRTVSRVLDVICNQTGATRGGTVRKIAKDQMDEQEPDWPSATASTDVLYWMPHENEPRDFYVQPPAASGASVRCKVALVPSSASTIEVIDAARDALVAYVIARCWAKDATYAKGTSEYMALFDAELKLLLGGDNRNYQQVQERQKPR